MKYLVSLSGGKDSTACLLWALDNFKKEDIVPYYIDTKWEHHSVYEYLEYLEEQLDIRIVRINSEGMEELCKRKRMMPNPCARFCTENLKIKTAIEFYYYWFISKGIDFINIAGIRREESKARANTECFAETEEKYEGKKFRIKNLYPIAYWGIQRVFDYLKEHKVSVNPLYKKGFTRVGCYPCIFATKDELTNLEPEYKKRLRNLEDEISKIVGKKVTFFQPKRDKHIKQGVLDFDLGCVNQYGICG